MNKNTHVASAVASSDTTTAEESKVINHTPVFSYMNGLYTRPFPEQSLPAVSYMNGLYTDPSLAFRPVLYSQKSTDRPSSADVSLNSAERISEHVKPA